MPTTTTNLMLNKPDATDAPDIEVLNDNMDKIDEAFGKVAQIEAGSDITE